MSNEVWGATSLADGADAFGTARAADARRTAGCDGGPAPRRPHRLVADERAHRSIERHGFAVLGRVLDDAAIVELRRRHARLADVLAPVVTDHWYTSGALRDPEARRLVYELVGEVVRPAVAAVTAPGVSVLAGNFHVNPPGGTAGLGPHQDVALVRERVASTANGWIPLQDVTIADGPLHVVPGSHRFGNPDRSLAVPWAYEGLHDVFWRHARPLDVPAGHLVLFDTELVHCSTANTSREQRLAVNCLLVPDGAPLQHLVAPHDSPGMVDVYRIDPAFLIGGDLSGPPGDEQGTWLERRSLDLPATDPDVIEAWCQAGAASLDVAGDQPPAGGGPST